MKFTFITIFPELINDFCKEGLLAKAVRTKKIQIDTINPRDFTHDVHQTVDDAPYGGGEAGMIMKIEPLAAAIRKAVGKNKSNPSTSSGRWGNGALVVLLSPSKQIFNQQLAVKWTKLKHLVLVCGRYEGVDARIEKYVDVKISLGEFVVMGGEVAGLTILEAVGRLLPGVIGHEVSLAEESYGERFKLEYPHYTRPEIFERLKVPKVLLSGNHQKIKEWRKKHSK